MEPSSKSTKELWRWVGLTLGRLEAGKGTGLGLSIGHGIITAHGGKIYAESELGQGTTFVVELPIVSINREGAYE